MMVRSVFSRMEGAAVFVGSSVEDPPGFPQVRGEQAGIHETSGLSGEGATEHIRHAFEMNFQYFNFIHPCLSHEHCSLMEGLLK